MLQQPQQRHTAAGNGARECQRDAGYSGNRSTAYFSHGSRRSSHERSGNTAKKNRNAAGISVDNSTHVPTMNGRRAGCMMGSNGSRRRAGDEAAERECHRPGVRVARPLEQHDDGHDEEHDRVERERPG